MGRSVLFVIALSALLAGRAQAQSTIGVTAVIVEPVTAVPVQLDVSRDTAGRLTVRRASGASEDSRLIRRSYIRGAELRPGGRVRVEEAGVLTVTNVIAANS